MSPEQILGTRAVPVPYGEPKAFHLPDWGKISDPERITILRRIVMGYGRDPRVATLAVEILKRANVPVRAYKEQAAALLSWVQNNIYYVNEPGERLQAPDLTISLKYGDCDDLALLLAALCESIRLPWKFVLSGANPNTKLPIRWVEGEPPIKGIMWSHIYLVIGDKPFGPCIWHFAEPTMKKPLGWDVVSAQSKALPELNLAGWHAPSSEAGGQVAAASITDSGVGINWKQVGLAVVVGVSVTVLSQVALSAIHDAYPKLGLKSR